MVARRARGREIALGFEEPPESPARATRRAFNSCVSGLSLEHAFVERELCGMVYGTKLDYLNHNTWGHQSKKTHYTDLETHPGIVHFS